MEPEQQEDDELTQKQTYLRESILEKGYDADEFMKFLQDKKGEQGLDLNSWKLPELTDAVLEFVKDKDPQPNNEIEEIPDQEEEQQTNTNNNAINEQEYKTLIEEEEPYDLDKFNKEHPYEPKIVKEEYGHCDTTEITDFSNKSKILVTLSFPEKVDGGIFSKSFITYLVKTEPFNFKNRKRYSDFNWLRRVLSIIYCNCVIPPLCKKNFGDRFNECLIAKRTRSIEKFMEGILIHPLIKNNNILYDFLSIEKEEDFKKKKHEYGKITSPTQVKEFKSLDGQMKITVTKEKETYFQNIKDNSIKNEELLQKVTKNYKALILLMQQSSEKMKEISDLWKTIYEKSIKYSDSYNTSQSYHIMSKLMEDWSESHKQQLNIINIKIREYFRYIKNEYHSISELASKVDANKNLFYKSFEKLINNKESLFKQQDLTLWGLNQQDMDNKLMLLKNKEYAFSKMLPKETKKLSKFKNFYGCYLNSIIDEFERIRELNGTRHKDNVNLFLKKLSDRITDFHVSLADRMVEFREKKEPKTITTDLKTFLGDEAEE